MAQDYVSPNLGSGSGSGLRLSVDGCPEYMLSGLTIDWSLVAAVAGSDVTLNDGTVIKVGQKYLRYGQCMGLMTATKKWAPFDPAGSGGREVVPAAGVPFCVLDVTHMETVTGAPTTQATNFGSAIIGGLVWKERLLATSGTASLAAGPTYASLLAALPRLVWPNL